MDQEKDNRKPEVAILHGKRNLILIFLAVSILATVTVIVQELRKISPSYRTLNSSKTFEYKVTGF